MKFSTTSENLIGRILWRHSPGVCFVWEKTYFASCFQVIHLRVSRNVVVHTFLWCFKHIKTRSLLVVGRYIRRQFLVVCVLFGLSCIMDGPLGCPGRIFWHQMSWIFRFLLNRCYWRDIGLLAVMIVLFSFLMGSRLCHRKILSFIVQVPLFGVNSCSRTMDMLLFGLLELFLLQ